MALQPRSTTLLAADTLGRRLGCRLWLATETFQVTGSFKYRAAFHVASHVSQTHIIAASSGNFGQALACACRELGKSCTIVMPDTSASVKVEAVRGFGGEADLIDVALVGRAQRVAQLASERPGAYVASAYDDPLVIAGNASLGDELACVAPAFDLVVAPVGGGGLTSGLVVGLARSGSGAQVVGAEPLMGNDGARSLREGRIVANATEPQTLADGARTVSLGRHNWAVLQSGLADIVEVPEEAIAEGVRRLFLDANLKCEPTGALAIGAILCEPGRFADKRVCCVVSGGNVDPGVYAGLITG